MRILMNQSLSTVRGHLYQAGKEYEVDAAFGQSLVNTNTAVESNPDKPPRAVVDRTEASAVEHALTRGKADRVTMDKPKSAKV